MVLSTEGRAINDEGVVLRPGTAPRGVCHGGLKLGKGAHPRIDRRILHVIECGRAVGKSLETFAVSISPTRPAFLPAWGLTLPRARGVTLEVWRSLCALRAHVVHTR